VPLFEVHYLDDRPHETVEAQTCELQGAHLVFVAPVLVMGRPRDVVRRRLPAADVREVKPAGAP
jgi:hypothetical protein